MALELDLLAIALVVLGICLGVLIILSYTYQHDINVRETLSSVPGTHRLNRVRILGVIAFFVVIATFVVLLFFWLAGQIASWILQTVAAVLAPMIAYLITRALSYNSDSVDE